MSYNSSFRNNREGSIVSNSRWKSRKPANTISDFSSESYQTKRTLFNAVPHECYLRKPNWISPMMLFRKTTFEICSKTAISINFSKYGSIFCLGYIRLTSRFLALSGLEWPLKRSRRQGLVNDVCHKYHLRRWARACWYYIHYNCGMSLFKFVILWTSKFLNSLAISQTDSYLWLSSCHFVLLFKLEFHTLQVAYFYFYFVQTILIIYIFVFDNGSFIFYSKHFITCPMWFFSWSLHSTLQKRTINHSWMFSSVW